MTLKAPIPIGSCTIVALAASATMAMANAPELNDVPPLDADSKLSIPVPEPSSAAMIGLVGVALIFRKRK
jgi:hypothetical protein